MNLASMSRGWPLIAALALVSNARLEAQSFDFQLQPSVSQLNLAMDTDLATPGQLIGDYDVSTNPGGTRTLPGLFGGGTNEPIPLDLTIQAQVSLADGPAGGFSMDVDTQLALFELSQLDLQLGSGGSPGDADLGLLLDFDTFRSFAPDSLFLGGIPITLPLGTAAVGQASLVQQGTAIGSLTPNGAGWDLSVLALVELQMDLDINGTITPVGPIPLALPLVGTLELAAGTANVAIQALLQDSATLPTTGLVITDQPFALPTILPPGGTANVLYSGEVTSIFYVLDLDLALFAFSPPACGASSFCTAAPNSVGPGALMGTNGQHSVAQNQFELSAGPVPSQPGLFFYSEAQTNGGAGLPFGNGLRCVGAGGFAIIRLPVLAASGGSFHYTPDLGAPPSASGTILGGSVWNFQCWYRDPAAGGASFNLSDGISVRFCP